MDIHIQRERKKQDELERVHERNFENPKLMRQILIVNETNIDISGKLYICIKFLMYQVLL